MIWVRLPHGSWSLRNNDGLTVARVYPSHDMPNVYHWGRTPQRKYWPVSHKTLPLEQAKEQAMIEVATAMLEGEDL